MEAMEVFMTKKTRRRYSDEFKADAVSLVTEQGYAVSEAARRLGVDRSLLDRWCCKHRQQDSGIPGWKEDGRDAEIKKLREEVRNLQIEKDILKEGGGLLRQRVELRYQFIESEKATYPVAVLCRVMQVCRSGFYAWRQRAPDGQRQALHHETPCSPQWSLC
jgi:transposase